MDAFDTLTEMASGADAKLAATEAAYQRVLMLQESAGEPHAVKLAVSAHEATMLAGRDLLNQ